MQRRDVHVPDEAPALRQPCAKGGADHVDAEEVAAPRLLGDSLATEPHDAARVIEADAALPRLARPHDERRGAARRRRVGGDEGERLDVREDVRVPDDRVPGAAQEIRRTRESTRRAEQLALLGDGDRRAARLDEVAHVASAVVRVDDDARERRGGKPVEDVRQSRFDRRRARATSRRGPSAAAGACPGLPQAPSPGAPWLAG